MKRATRQYYFSVEDETEKMYFEWLKNTINAQPNTKFNVVFKCSVEKNPMSFVKKLSVLGKTKIVHIFDYESNESDHTRLFLSTLDSMREAESLSVGKKIK